MQHVLVSGCFHSGTTWVGKMLCKSEEIEYFHEPFNLDYGPLQQWIEYIPQDSTTYLPFFQEQFSSSRKLMKDPLAIFSVNWLAHHFQIKPILLIRHPAAFYTSFLERGRIPRIEILSSQKELMRVLPSEIRKQFEAYAQETTLSKAKFCTAVWNATNWFILQYKKQHPDWLFIRHEDISISPVDSFKQLFEYAQLSFTQDVKDNIIETSGFSGETNYRSYHRDSKSEVKKWKTRLSTEEITKIKSLTSEISAHFYSEEDW